MRAAILARLFGESFGSVSASRPDVWVTVRSRRPDLNSGFPRDKHPEKENSYGNCLAADGRITTESRSNRRKRKTPRNHAPQSRCLRKN
jgi:hypothetical protein